MPEKSSVSVETKELGRRRVFIFISAFSLIAFSLAAIEEGDIFTHAFDEYVLAGIALISLVIILSQRKKISLSELRKQHNIITLLYLIAFLATLYALPAEIADMADFGNEIPSLILIVLTFLNRFL